MQEDTSVAGREGGLGKKCVCRLLFWRKEKAEGHGGWGEVPKPWTGGEEGQGRMRTQPPEEHSVQKFLTPSPPHPSSSPLSCPLGALESGQFFRPKRPHDITSTATDGL